MPAAASVQQQREWLGKPCLLTSEQQGRRRIPGKERKEERGNTKKKRKAERLERKTKGVRGKAFFWIGRRRISQVGLSLTLSYLILRVTLRFLLIFR